ncbi:ATP-binding protein [Streptomyces sp. NBC_01186]|uniref:sensor histidine kinase n=1 Tax=Streptomyces sp. NBC_01186 TaxID=2903765 RepID=UPI002E0E32C5|nr:ATP-binding protein [Streptomyces sp. NBC_01186]
MPATASEPARPRGRIRWSARLRLTLMYGALFLVSGIALLGSTYLLVASSPANKNTRITAWRAEDPLHDGRDRTQTQIAHVVSERRSAELRTLLTESGVALAGMTGVSVALGWFMAGRVLRPVRTMADKARRISERNLHERLAVTGPADELKELGDTFDGLLSRLDAAFEAQKRFVANASHELRTPLTLQRATIEVALAEPDAEAAALREVCTRVLAAGESQERLIEALLTLASSQRGLDPKRSGPVDLAAVTRLVLRDREEPRAGVALAPAPTHGDAALVERLATNLVENTQRYTPEDGWIHVSTGTSAGRPYLHVANSGEAIPQDRIPVLYQPFQRLGPRGAGEGHGLGLSIVAAVAAAHGAVITTVPGPEGGLAVTVAFPPSPPSPSGATAGSERRQVVGERPGAGERPGERVVSAGK